MLSAGDKHFVRGSSPSAKLQQKRSSRNMITSPHQKDENISPGQTSSSDGKEVSVETILDDLVNLVSSLENVAKGLKYMGKEASAEVKKLTVEADKLTILLDDMLDYPGAQAVIIGTKVPVEIAKGIKSVAKSLKQYEKNVNDQLKKFDNELENEVKERNERNTNSSTNNEMLTPVKNGNGDSKNDNDDLRTPSPMKKNDNRKDDNYNNNNNNNNIIDESASSSNGGLGFLTGLFSPSTSNLNPNKEGKNDEDGGNDKSFVTYHIMYVLETLSTKVGVLRWNETEASAEQRIQESKLADAGELRDKKPKGCFGGCFGKKEPPSNPKPPSSPKTSKYNSNSRGNNISRSNNR